MNNMTKLKMMNKIRVTKTGNSAKSVDGKLNNTFLKYKFTNDETHSRADDIHNKLNFSFVSFKRTRII